MRLDGPAKKRQYTVACAVVSLFALCAPIAASAAEPIGEWVVANGSARIKIDKCGEGYWGIVAWEQNAGRDENNPDPAKRDVPTLGLPILLNMQPKQRDRWEGKVYNAENGKTYSSSIKLTSADVLEIEGCVLGFLCGGETWTRFKRPADRSTKADPGMDVCLSVTRATGTPHERRLK